MKQIKFDDHKQCNFCDVSQNEFDQENNDFDDDQLKYR